MYFYFLQADNEISIEDLISKYKKEPNEERMEVDSDDGSE